VEWLRAMREAKRVVGDEKVGLLDDPPRVAISRSLNSPRLAGAGVR
jgi:hypothetical protein